VERDVDEEAVRLLDRVAGAVPVAPAPVGRLVDVARRQQRRRHLAVLLAVVLLVMFVLASLGALSG
jgi:heme A synthase